MLYFGIKKEGLEKKFEYFFIGSELVQYSPYYLPLNVFTASKGSNLCILFLKAQHLIEEHPLASLWDSAK